jgi:hypothetical protein
VRAAVFLRRHRRAGTSIVTGAKNRCAQVAGVSPVSSVLPEWNGAQWSSRAAWGGGDRRRLRNGATCSEGKPASQAPWGTAKGRELARWLATTERRNIATVERNPRRLAGRGKSWGAGVAMTLPSAAPGQVRRACRRTGQAAARSGRKQGADSSRVIAARISANLQRWTGPFTSSAKRRPSCGDSCGARGRADSDFRMLCAK